MFVSSLYKIQHDLSKLRVEHVFDIQCSSFIKTQFPSKMLQVRQGSREKKGSGLNF